MSLNPLPQWAVGGALLHPADPLGWQVVCDLVRPVDDAHADPAGEPLARPDLDVLEHVAVDVDAAGGGDGIVRAHLRPRLGWAAWRSPATRSGNPTSRAAALSVSRPCRRRRRRRGARPR